MKDPWRQTHCPEFVIPEADFSLMLVVSDLHGNSTRGVFPPRFQTIEGLTVQASNAQRRYLWKPWQKMWKDVGAFREKYQNKLKRVILVHDGDGVDRNKWDPEGYELISPHREDIVNIGEKVLNVAKPHVDVALINRGTQSHVGQAGELEELLARRLLDDGWKIIPPKEGTALSHYWPELIFDGVRMQFGHNPGTRTTKEHLRGQAANRKAFDMVSTYSRIGRPFPQAIVYAHVHYASHSTQHPIHVFYNPAWQLATIYAHQIGVSGKQEPVGSWWFLLSEGRMQADLWSYLPKPDVTVFDGDSQDIDEQIDAYRARLSKD